MSNLKFKIGQEVKFIGDGKRHSPDIRRNATGKIEAIKENTNFSYGIQFDAMDSMNWCNNEELELVQPKAFTKQDLKERWLVKTRNSEEYMVDLEEEILKEIKNEKFEDGGFMRLSEYNDDLTCREGRKWDIVEIYRPTYETVWTRTEDKPIEMSISEIKEKLGIAEDVEFKIVEENE